MKPLTKKQSQWLGYFVPVTLFATGLVHNNRWMFYFCTFNAFVWIAGVNLLVSLAVHVLLLLAPVSKLQAYRQKQHSHDAKSLFSE